MMGEKTLLAEGSECGLTATGTSRSHQVLQAASASLMGTLDEIQT